MNLKENKLIKYFYEAKTELEKVTWPSRKETLVSTLTVIGVSVGTAVFLGALDFGLNKALAALIASQQ
jgi:preprotein translocase subunit SecE